MTLQEPEHGVHEFDLSLCSVTLFADNLSKTRALDFLSREIHTPVTPRNTEPKGLFQIEKFIGYRRDRFATNQDTSNNQHRLNFTVWTDGQRARATGLIEVKEHEAWLKRRTAAHGGCPAAFGSGRRQLSQPTDRHCRLRSDYHDARVDPISIQTSPERVP
jgi:hypothetical protein